MEYTTWLIYLGVISVLIFTPGPSALLCMSHGLKFGKTKSMATVLGGAISALVLMGISMIGLGAVLAASETAFLVVKLLGTAYLIYLGVSAWKNSYTQSNNTELLVVNAQSLSFTALFRKGFLVGISNPKDILFFAALLPSFISGETSSVTQYIILASTWFIVDISAMYMYASLGCKVSPWLTKAKNLKRFERTTGSFFIFTGGALIASSNK